MADTLKIEVGETATVMLAFAGKYDQSMTPTDVAASTDNQAVAVVTSHGSAVDVAGAAVGTATVTVATPDASTSFLVDVAAPKAVRVEALVAAATFRKS